jgi:hypothetical protein
MRRTKKPSEQANDFLSKMREAERAARGKKQSNEQASRDDWPRAWKWLDPLFGDVNPRTIRPEHFISIDAKTGDVTGLIPTVERAVSITERHRTIKVWRALWKKMATMGYCDRDADPSLVFANSAPPPRQDIWKRHEVLRLVQCAWRNNYHGLAATIAVAWDSMLSPVDARTLVASQRARDSQGALFFLDRAKTGRAAAGTLTRWSESILDTYLAGLGADLHGDAPLFRNRSGLPYSKDTLGDDFREIRQMVFHGDSRQLADMRRSGAVEADAGGASTADLSNKMANTISASNRLRKTYNPVNVESVRRVDEARKNATRKERKPHKSVTAPDRKVSPLSD